MSSGPSSSTSRRGLGKVPPREAPPWPGTPLPLAFFDRDARVVARALLGKVLCHRAPEGWLAASIVETEAYFRREKASHASLGASPSRRALFMPPGTIYMYFARGGDSFNVSCRGAGNAVLVKAGVPYDAGPDGAAMVARMTRRNPLPSGAARPSARLCAGQTLLCRALGLHVAEWDGRPLDGPDLRVWDVSRRPASIVETTRLGIPPGRDGHLPYRFIDADRTGSATHDPVRSRTGSARAYRLTRSPPARVW